MLVSLLNRKALGPNGILNKILKVLVNEIRKGIKKGINESLVKRILLVGYIT